MLRFEIRGRPHAAPLAQYLAPERAEDAERLGNVWIKSLRTARVDGRPLRDRFTHHGDSLWWFAELYLHKQRSVAQWWAAAFAVEAAIAREQPDAIGLTAAGRIAALAAPQIAAAHGVRWLGTAGTGERLRGLRTAVAARLHAQAPRLSRRRRGAADPTPAPIVVFVHSAFWKDTTSDDTYVGPVLRELAARAPAGHVRFVGVGPQTTHRARTWRDRVGEFAGYGGTVLLAPIEAFARADTLDASRDMWKERRAVTRVLQASADLRAAARLGAADAWPIVSEDLSGIASLQFPWSVRAMDEAASVLDALQPRAIVTYAEAGGWGRALTLEARRRGIVSIGLQHGFISRHWLNYLHEPDEIEPSPQNAADRGCPIPDLTLLYDEQARAHLLTAGRYPAHRLRVTGNPRLDALVAAARALTPDDIRGAKRAAGARDDQHLVLLAAKRIPEFDATFDALMRAAASMPDVHLAVRPHPAETAAPYEALAAGLPNVRVVPLSLNPVALIAAARLVATINSTVAIEAMALDVPALAMRMPNYLSPFVDAGAMAGTGRLDEIAPALGRLVHDDTERARLAAGRRTLFSGSGTAIDGRAAERAADAILDAAAR